MSRRPVAKTPWVSVALVLAAIALWALDQKPATESPRKPATAAVESSAKPETAGVYEVYHRCALVEARHNDGDSFMLRLPDGRKAEFRLYFVDVPESAFKSYAGGDTNHERIRQQASDLGAITPEQAVDIGMKGKALTVALLGAAPFTIFTRWDSPFHDGRYHAFVKVTDGGRFRWLHEILVERGLARIKTKGADLPDGTPASRQLGRLRDLERQARSSRKGVWGL